MTMEKTGQGAPKVTLGGGHPIRVGGWSRRTPDLFYLVGRGGSQAPDRREPPPPLRALGQHPLKFLRGDAI